MSEPAHPIDLQDSQTAALAVAAGGVVAFVIGRILDSAVLRVIGAVVAVAGGGFYARRRLTERSKRIEVAASHIRSELDDLDPVAKAQVIADLTQP